MIRRRRALAYILIAGLTLSNYSSFSKIRSRSLAESETTPVSEEADPNANEIAINEKNFPDRVFREYVKSFDTDNNGRFSSKEISNVISISIYYDNKFESAEGIGYFTELQSLDIGDCPLITKLDLRKNTKLTRIFCDFDEHLTSIDISKCTLLTDISFQCSGLESLDVSKNTALTSIYCNYNKLTSLDVSTLPSLVKLNCSGNQLKSLNLSKNTELTDLSCESNKITSLDISKNRKIVSIDFGNNPMKMPDISKLPELSSLCCSRLGLTSLDLSKNTKLTNLDCGGNALTSLDVSMLTDLRYLYCRQNKLSSLNVSKNAELNDLDCAENKLTSLDVSKNTLLSYLNCNSNLLSSINLSQCANIYTLLTHSNQIEKLDVTDCAHIVSAMKNCKLISDGSFLVFTDPEKGDWIFSFDRQTQVIPEIGVPTPSPLPTVQPTLAPTTTPLPTTSPAPIDNKGFEGFVERLYKIALNREPEAEGKAFWVKHVVEDGATGADCARFFLLDAPEFMNRGLNNDQFVETLYSVFFDRASEPGGKAFWLGQLAAGVSKQEVVNGFIESVEWCNVCSGYGVKSGAKYHKATTPSANAEAFATRLYTECLKRQPEQQGLRFWALALTNLDKNAAEAGDLFFSSEEFVGFKTTDQEYIARLYRTFMGRDADKDGMKYWLTRLSFGCSRYEALKSFAESPEFTSLCKQYGIDRGMLPEKPTKILISLLAMSSELSDFVKLYYDTHPDFAAKYQIYCNYLPNDNHYYENTLKKALENNSVDLYMVEADYAYDYTKGSYSSYAAPYDQVFPDFVTRLQNADIMPYTVSIGTRPSDGKVVGLSYQSTGGVFIYRRSIAKDVFGSDDPSTVAKAIGAGTNSWDTFLKAAEALNKKDYCIISSLADLWYGDDKAAKTPWVVSGKFNIDPLREKHLDISKTMIDKGYCHDVNSWMSEWYEDMRGEGDRKVFGFFGPAWFINYIISTACTEASNGYGDWAVCEAPYSTYWGGSWLLANKSTLGTEKAAGIAEIVNFITLDCTENGGQYKWATGQINGYHDTVASRKVMGMLSGSWGILGGQNPYSILTNAGSKAHTSSYCQYDGDLNGIFLDVNTEYSHGRIPREAAIKKLKEAAAKIGLS